MNLIYSKSKKMLADTLTPVSAYLKLRDIYPNSILLESNDFHHAENSRSFICLDPIAGIEVSQSQIKTLHPGSPHYEEFNTEQFDPLEKMKQFFDQFSFRNQQHSFNGFYGYCSYEAIQYFESIDLRHKKDLSAIPLIRYHLYRFIITFNHLKNEIEIVENSIYPDRSGIKSLIDQLNNNKIAEFKFNTKASETTITSDQDFKNLVSKAKEHCNKGDIFQMVISRRFSQPFFGDEFQVYRQLRSINPSPYLFYFDYGNYKIFGSSPESQLVVDNGRAVINPIAGTFKRTGNDSEDQKLAQQLIDDPKENAEHVMLVDLARNDLSKRSGNVKVEKYQQLHFYSHVIHIVSEVAGTLDKKENAVQVFADTFPAGTLTGAPKYKAMQLIDQYEPEKRNYYGGAIGFFNTKGDTNHAIIIRSFLSKESVLYYQAGAGIVSKSEEDKELMEVKNKLAALRLAIKQASQESDKTIETENILQPAIH